MVDRFVFLAATTTLLAQACSSSQSEVVSRGPPTPPHTATAVALAPASTAAAPIFPLAAPPTASASSPATAETAGTGRPCGPLGCQAFDTAEQALSQMLDKTKPAVLGVGEIHAQKGNQLKATPTARFTDLLPFFRGKSKDIVLELWTGRNDCGDDRVKQVEAAQKPVTQAQAATNKNEFFELGTQAKAQGIFPHALVPTCEDYRNIVAARADDIAKMLELTAKKTQEVVGSALRARQGAEGHPFVITYGGALHNDLYPREGRESWTFGPALFESTKGHFVELDLVLREQVRNTESFTSFPWYPYYRTESLEKHYVLYETGPSSFALIFPEQQYLK